MMLISINRVNLVLVLTTLIMKTNYFITFIIHVKVYYPIVTILMPPIIKHPTLIVGISSHKIRPSLIYLYILRNHFQSLNSLSTIIVILRFSLLQVIDSFLISILDSLIVNLSILPIHQY